MSYLNIESSSHINRRKSVSFDAGLYASNSHNIPKSGTKAPFERRLEVLSAGAGARSQNTWSAPETLASGMRLFVRRFECSADGSCSRSKIELRAAVNSTDDRVHLGSLADAR